MKDNIYVSGRKKMNKDKCRQISGWEIPGGRKLPRYHEVLSWLQILVSSIILFSLSVPN